MTRTTLRTVNPKDISVPTLRINSYMGEELQAEFIQSVKETGIEQPPQCIEVEGKLVVVDGRHRVEAAVAAGMERIEVIVRPGTLRDTVVSNIKTSWLRGKPDPVELLDVVKFLMTEERLTSDQVAKETGLTRNYIEDLQWLYQAGGPVVEKFREGAIGKAHAVALARVSGEDMRAVLLEQCLTFNWTEKDLKEHIKNAQEIAQEPRLPPPEKPAPQAGLVRCVFDDLDHDPRTVKYVPICEDGLAELIKARQAAATPAAQPAS